MVVKRVSMRFFGAVYSTKVVLELRGHVVSPRLEWESGMGD